jgi:hypothetical protein
MRLRQKEANANMQRAAENSAGRPQTKNVPLPEASKGRPGIKHEETQAKGRNCTRDVTNSGNERSLRPIALATTTQRSRDL